MYIFSYNHCLFWRLTGHSDLIYQITLYGCKRLVVSRVFSLPRNKENRSPLCLGGYSHFFVRFSWYSLCFKINHLNDELNPICHLLALLGAHHIFHVSRVRVKIHIWRNVIYEIRKYKAGANTFVYVSRCHNHIKVVWFIVSHVVTET